MRVGLTGGIGSGKSEVGKIFERLGAFVIDTDLVAREAVAPRSDGLLAIARIWPQAVRDGILDRRALADIVFADAAARARLNEIVHPFVRRLAFESERRALPGQLIVHVVPLLFETNYQTFVAKSVLVVAPDDERIARVMARDGIDESHIRARMAAQIDPNVARVRADYTIENDADLAHVTAQAQAVYASLSAMALEMPPASSPAPPTASP